MSKRYYHTPKHIEYVRAPHSASGGKALRSLRECRQHTRIRCIVHIILCIVPLQSTQRYSTLVLLSTYRVHTEYIQSTCCVTRPLPADCRNLFIAQWVQLNGSAQLICDPLPIAYCVLPVPFISIKYRIIKPLDHSEFAIFVDLELILRAESVAVGFPAIHPDLRFRYFST